MPQPAPSLAVQPALLPTHTEPDTLFTRAFLLLCLSSFLFSSSMFLLFAVLPLFVVQELKGAQSQVGLIMGAFAISSVLSRPASGRLVDSWSRKAGLSLGALIYCVAPALYTQASSVSMMLGLRFFHGIGIAAYTTSGSVLVADLCPAARRGEGMGYYGMSMNLAMTIGPALGAALVGVVGFTGLFWLSASLAFASLLLVQFVREPHRPHVHAQVGVQRPPLFSRAALFPGFIAMCMTMTFGSVVSFLPL
ncbi:MAG: MFS transporter, partial [Deltaproteobacteria bacterium]|nr:MFS transporter [Deltaproteobacteria bacterium]